MTFQDKAVAQYLSRHAEPEAADALPVLSHSHCLVIPACREDWSAIRANLSAIDQPFLLILVANAPEPDRQTLALIEDARAYGTEVTRSKRLGLIEADGSFDILLVDRCSPGHTVAVRQGVGLARKIGADIALSLMVNRKLAPGLIYSSDADARLPGDYFRHPDAPDVAACLFPFTHRASPDVELATQIYETSLLYYVAGLRAAGSKYGFPAIGSTMAIDPVHYARVRGFPRRNAGEDFYLLNKLAKSGRIRQLSRPSITIEARRSDRVPFGTGPGLAKITALEDPTGQYGFYDPETFTLLGTLLTRLKTAREDPAVRFDDARLTAWSREAGLHAQLDRQYRQRKSTPDFDKSMSDWLDAFRTLKFVHFMRDNYLPPVSWQAVANAGLVTPPPTSLAALHEALRQKVLIDPA